VKTVVGRALKFMTHKEKLIYFVYLILRAIVAFLDLIGILAIGLLATSMALLVTDDISPTESIRVGAIDFQVIPIETLPIVATLVVLLFSAKALFSVIITRNLAIFLAGIEARGAKKIAERAFGQGLGGVRRNSKEEILFAVQVGSPSAFNSVLNSVGTLSAEGFLFFLVIAAFTIVNPGVSLGAIVYFGVIGFSIQFFIGRIMQKSGLAIADSTVKANSILSDLSDVFREVAVKGQQEYFFNHVYELRMKTSASAATQFVMSGMPRYIVETSLIVAIAVFVIIQSFTGEIASSAATIGIFLSGGLRLTSSLLPLQGALLSIKQSIPPANKALDILEGKSSFSEQEAEIVSEVHDPSRPLSVHIKDLSFGYQPGTPQTIDQITLDILEGTQVAVIGRSGSGKSTLADLMLGLLEPSIGSVQIAGTRPSTIIASNPGILGYVPQKPGMINGTIAENIAVGLNSEEINKTWLLNAISAAHLSDLIDSLPNGLETDMGKRKDELSGGQLQRIGLARALYSQPKLLIMDEATSALDAESENHINMALDQMRGKVTVILIAHRLNTVQRSDIVFLMEEGRIKDSGTFPELLKKNQTVQTLANLMSIDSQQ